jgi:catechol 2,3-dioxygenase-like lactoylglutathione lyase family enzyme
MWAMPRTVCVMAVALLTVGGSDVGSRTQRATVGPIRQIDHIMIRTGNPRDLYVFFTETLGLPIAWPMTSPRPGVVTGGVAFGNVNVEAIQFPWQIDSRPRLLGFALEPSGLKQTLSELKRRGIPSGEPRPLLAVGPDGAETALWTNVTLSQFSDADNPADAMVHIFLSEYSPAYVKVDERRARLRKQLVESGGGPLGIVEVKEVVIGAAELETARRLWQRLLDPIPSSTSNTWQVGTGPAVRLISAAENRVQTMVIRVASLDRAKTFLREKQMLVADPDGSVRIDPSKVGGLDLRVVDK